MVLLKYTPYPGCLQVKVLEWLLKCTPYLEPTFECFLPHSLLTLHSRFWIFKHDSLLRTTSFSILPLALLWFSDCITLRISNLRVLPSLVTTSPWWGCVLLWCVPRKSLALVCFIYEVNLIILSSIPFSLMGSQEGRLC